MTLQPLIQGNNTFCGPAVLAAILNVDTSKAASLLSVVTGKPADEIKGVYLRDLVTALESLKYKCYRLPVKGSIYTWIITHGVPLPGIYIVMVPGHFVLLEVADKTIYLLDNHTKKPINLGNSARLGQRAIAVVRVVKHG